MRSLWRLFCVHSGLFSLRFWPHALVYCLTCHRFLRSSTYYCVPALYIARLVGSGLTRASAGGVLLFIPLLPVSVKFVRPTFAFAATPLPAITHTPLYLNLLPPHRAFLCLHLVCTFLVLRVFLLRVCCILQPLAFLHCVLGGWRGRKEKRKGRRKEEEEENKKKKAAYFACGITHAFLVRNSSAHLYPLALGQTLRTCSNLLHLALWFFSVSLQPSPSSSWRPYLRPQSSTHNAQPSFPSFSI